MRQQESRSITLILSGLVAASVPWAVVVVVLWRRLDWTSDADTFIFLGAPLLACLALAIVLSCLRVARDLCAGIAVGAFALTCLLACALLLTPSIPD
jgi:hypothetical protein